MVLQFDFKHLNFKIPAFEFRVYPPPLNNKPNVIFFHLMFNNTDALTITNHATSVLPPINFDLPSSKHVFNFF